MEQQIVQSKLQQASITLTEEQQLRVRELAAKQKTSREIARILNVSDMKMWRNMKLMGLNGNKQPQKCHNGRGNKKHEEKPIICKIMFNEAEDIVEIFNCDFHAFAF